MTCRADRQLPTLGATNPTLVPSLPRRKAKPEQDTAPVPEDTNGSVVKEEPTYPSY